MSNDLAEMALGLAARANTAAGISAAGGALRSQIETVAKRPPGYLDDTAHGYSTLTIWQHEGNIYTPVDISNAGSAVWQSAPRTQVGKAADILGAPCVFAGGLVAMKAGYVGAAVDVTCTIASTPTTATGNILPNGELDVATLMATLSRSDAGTDWRVSKVYDQTGTGNHLVQFNSVQLPLFVYDPLFKRFSIVWESKSVATALRIPDTVSLNPTSFSAFFISRCGPSAGGGNGKMQLLSLGIYTGGGSNAYQLQNAGNGGLAVWATTGGDKNTAQPYPILDAAPCVVSIVGGASSTLIGVNEHTQSIASAPVPNLSLTGGLIGNNNIGSGGDGAQRIIGLALSNTPASAAAQSAIRRSAYVDLKMCPQARDTVVFIGDSRTASFKTDGAIGLVEGTLRNITKPIRCLNFGKGSQTLAEMNTDTLPQAVRYVSSGGKNIAVVLGGLNDKVVNDSTTASVYATLQTVCSTLRTAGFKVIVIAELAVSSAPNNAWLQAYRALIVAGGSALADAIVDLSGCPPIMAGSNATFYPDGVHETADLNLTIGSILGPVMNRMLD